MRTSPSRREGNDFENDANLLAQHLPRHDVGMMFEGGNEYFVPGFQKFAPPRLRDEINRFGAAMREDDFIVMFGIDETPHRAAHGFVFVGRALAQPINAAMDVGVIVFHEARHRLNHHAWFLRRCRRVEIDERMPKHRLRQNGKILTILFDGKCTWRRAGEQFVFRRITNRAGDLYFGHLNDLRICWRKVARHSST